MFSKIIIASNNEGKVQELTTLFAPYQITAESYETLHERVTFPKERLDDYRVNARQKAVFIAQLLQTDLPVLGDDSGIELAAYPQRFQAATKQDLAAGAPLSHNQYLLQLMGDRPKEERGITLLAYLVLAVGSQCFEATGAVKGTVAASEQGDYGFDLDRVVIPKHETQTLAQMPLVQRRRYLQRQQAVARLIQEVKDETHEDS